MRPGGPQRCFGVSQQADALLLWHIALAHHTTLRLPSASQRRLPSPLSFSHHRTHPAPPHARPTPGELEVTYLDDQLRISRGDKGNLFILTQDGPDADF